MDNRVLVRCKCGTALCFAVPFSVNAIPAQYRALVSFLPREMDLTSAVVIALGLECISCNPLTQGGRNGAEKDG